MNTLDQQSLADLNERFCSFNDGVLRRWDLVYSDAGPIVNINIEVQDRSLGELCWSMVNIRLSGCSSIRFVESRKSNYQVLSNGLHIIFDDEQIGVEFGDFTDAPRSLEELISSPIHVVAKRIEWQLAPCD
jgi:uncharacterized protein YceK